MVPGTIAFTTAIPSNDPCLAFGDSWLYTLDYATGGMVDGETAAFTARNYKNVLLGRPISIRTDDPASPGGTTRKSQFHSIAGTTRGEFVKAESGKSMPAPSGRRVNWREVILK